MRALRGSMRISARCGSPTAPTKSIAARSRGWRCANTPTRGCRAKFQARNAVPGGRKALIRNIDFMLVTAVPSLFRRGASRNRYLECLCTVFVLDLNPKSAILSPFQLRKVTRAARTFARCVVRAKACRSDQPSVAFCARGPRARRRNGLAASRGTPPARGPSRPGSATASPALNNLWKDRYWKLLSDLRIQRFFIEDLWGQAERQVEAAGERRIRWYFSEKKAADYVRDLFRDDPIRDRIDIVHAPMPESAR